VRVFLISLFLIVFSLPVLAVAQSEAQVIDVLDVRGPISDYTVEYVISSLEKAAREGSMLVILQIDSPGAVTEDVSSLIQVIQASSVPVVAWVGDAPADAFGSAYALADGSHLMVVAPGSTLGYGPEVTLIGSPSNTDVEMIGTEDRLTTSPSLGDLVVSLDSMMFETASGQVTMDTAELITNEDGEQRNRVTPQVRFSEPSLIARTMSLSLRPEAIFFFLTVGLAFVAFEIYAVGPGVAAATAVAPLFLAGYGLTVLPIGWGLAVVLCSMWLLTADFQRGGFGILSYFATALLFVGGLFITATRPEMPPPVWATLIVTIGIGLFYMFAMPTVARVRFTSSTIGREYLIGETGKAITSSVNGELLVEIRGARWRASAHRESEIQADTGVVVEGVQGLYLEVRPVADLA